MIKPAFPENEKERQKIVESYQILDTLEEDSYDDITSLLASICDTPISLVSILDNERNFLKSHYGVDLTEDVRERSFCGHTILEKDDFLVVPDATKDERFFDNPLVTEMGIRFYAGVPLKNNQGIKLGALCVVDTKPKTITKNQKVAIEKLAKQVVFLMESRLLSIDLINSKKFASVTSHDLKFPLSNIIFLTELLKESSFDKLSSDEKKYINLIKKSSNTLSKYITNLFKFYVSGDLSKTEKSSTKTKKLIRELSAVFLTPKNKLKFKTKLTSIQINKDLISQILINLISNGFKYNSSEIPKVRISIKEKKGNYYFEVKDNGIGIPESEQDKIFKLFETLDTKDRNGNKGTGIGLATVEKLINELGGTISLTSKINEGTTFFFQIPKKK